MFIRSTSTLQIILICGMTFFTVRAKIFDRCSLSNHFLGAGLTNYANFTQEMPIWLCIADKTAGFNTSHYREGDNGTNYFGILNISNEWCRETSISPNPCANCTRMWDDNTLYSALCAKTIFEFYGNFSYWAPETLCDDQSLPGYIEGCSDYTIFTSAGGPIDLVEGQTNVNITCSAKGGNYLAPILSWNGEKEEIMCCDDLQYEDDGRICYWYDSVPQDIEYFAYLSFEAVLSSDSGKYICVNEDGSGAGSGPWAGVAGQEFDLTVLETPVTTNFPTSFHSSSEEPTSNFPSTTKVSTTNFPSTTEESTTNFPSTTEESTTNFLSTTEEPTTHSPTTTEISEPTILSTTGFVSSTVTPTLPWVPSTTRTSTTLLPTTNTSPGITSTPSPGPGKIYTACELAKELTYLLDDYYDWDTEMGDWLCLSEHGAGFNDSYFEISDGDSSKVYYGIFKISNWWCRDKYDSTNPCNVFCDDLRGNLEESVKCSQKIFQESQFSQWPEYEANCPNVTTEFYLHNCYDAPKFDVNSETDKIFKEFDEFEEIVCSAYGFPPPEIYWDDETMNYIETSEHRVVINMTKIQGPGNNWRMKSLITFTSVSKKDQRAYTCNARNIAASISQAYSVRVITDILDPWEQALIIAGSFALGLLGLLAIPFAFLIYRRKKKKKNHLQKIYENFLYGNQTTDAADDICQNYLHTPEYLTYQKALYIPFAKYLVIPPHRLQLHVWDVLGSGAFGIVFKGVLDQLKVVAVKTVDKDADPLYLAALLSEVKIMSYVGKHSNIVELIGVQLEDLRKGLVFVAIEYCSRGSLEGILHAKRRALKGCQKYVGSFVIPPGYIGVEERSEELFSTSQLLTYCKQVCSAMEFLTFKRVVHGDLACRNVLVDTNMVAKISDFGLSKQIHDDNYKKYVFAAKETALPWRSLAIETLRHLKFSSASDVWAFGVFVWEVFSLADIPYTAAISWGPEFITYLETGYRLQIPEFATEEIYGLMKKCWKSEPSLRITFRQLGFELSHFLDVEHKK